MNINLVLSPYPTLLEDIVVKIYETTNPTAEVQSFTAYERDSSGVITPGAGHHVHVSVSFNGCEPMTHIVRSFTASGTLLHEYDRQPTVDTTTIFDPIYFRVGDGGTYTPVSSTNYISNPEFDGLTAEQLSICQEGLGFILPAVDYTLAGPMLSLIGSTFEDGQRWYITRKPEVITTYVNDSVVGKGFGGFLDVVANIDYVPGHLRKLIRFSGTGNYTFPSGASIPVGYIHSFNNFGTTGSLPQINFSNATLLYNGAPKSSMVVPFGSTFAVTFDGTNWNCILNDIKVASSGPVIGDIIGMGNYFVGDVSATAPDTFITVAHGLSIVGPYKVLGTLKGTFASRLNDNNVSWSAYDYTPDNFKLGLQEWAAGIQNIGFDYVLVKSDA